MVVVDAVAVEGHGRIAEQQHRGGLDGIAPLRLRRRLGAGAVSYTHLDLHPGLPSVRCVGYRQMWAHLDGEISLEDAREQGIAATRQLAKRQITWLRAQPERVIVDCLAADAVAQTIDAVATALADAP